MKRNSSLLLLILIAFVIATLVSAPLVIAGNPHCPPSGCGGGGCPQGSWCSLGGSSAVGGPFVDMTTLGPSFSTIYLATQTPNSPGAGIYISTNGGVSYTLLKNFTTPYGLSRNGTRLFAATSDGLFYTDNDKSWTQSLGGLPSSTAVTFVGVVQDVTGTALKGFQIYATVDPGTPLGGLYLSLDDGKSWQLVMPHQDVRAIVSKIKCANETSTRVIAGGKAGSGLPGSLWISNNGGLANTWSSSSFPTSLVNDLGLVCTGNPILNPFEGLLFVTNGDTTSTTPVWRSSDFGTTFSTDSFGIAATTYIASNVHDPGDFINFYAGATVGSLGGATLGDGLFVRNAGATTWSQFTLNGLSDFRIVKWATVTDPVNGKQRFVIIHPLSTQYYNE